MLACMTLPEKARGFWGGRVGIITQGIGVEAADVLIILHCVFICVLCQLSTRNRDGPHCLFLRGRVKPLNAGPQIPVVDRTPISNLTDRRWRAPRQQFAGWPASSNLASPYN